MEWATDASTGRAGGSVQPRAAVPGVICVTVVWCTGVCHARSDARCRGASSCHLVRLRCGMPHVVGRHPRQRVAARASRSAYSRAESCPAVTHSLTAKSPATRACLVPRAVRRYLPKLPPAASGPAPAAERTAYPSLTAARNGGNGCGARTSSDRTRPSESGSRTASAARRAKRARRPSDGGCCYTLRSSLHSSDP